MVKALVALKVDLSETNRFGSTALGLAAQQGRLDVVECLFPIMAKNTDDPSFWVKPLMDASRDGQTDVVAYLLAQDCVDVNQVCEAYDDMTALHLAAECGRQAVVDCLLARQANPAATDANGMTPLHYAFCRDSQTNFSLKQVMVHHTIAACLIDKKCEVNAQDGKGNTALHYARQAQWEWQNELDYARRSPDVVRADREHQSSSSDSESDAPTSLNIHDSLEALVSAYDKIISMLLTAGADDELANYDGETPSAYAEKRGARLDGHADMGAGRPAK